MSEDDRCVLVERRGTVLVLTLNRPQAYNAFDRAQSVQLSEALDLLDQDGSLKAVVITGAGGRFCAGTDLKAAARNESVDVPPRGYYGMLRQPPVKPTICAVEGYALGGGWELTMAADLTVAAESAQFGLPEVKRGLIASGGALHRLPRQVPFHVAMDLLLTGRTIGAAEAARLGLVARVVAPGTALEAAVELAGEIGGGGPRAVESTKRAVLRSLDLDQAAGWELAEELADQIRGSAEMEEGVAAFVEKRAPHWQTD
jgi:enoyl-CoA hydratase